MRTASIVVGFLLYRLAGSNVLRQQIREGQTEEEIRKKYLLYAE